MRSFMILLLTCSVSMSVLAIFYMAVTPFLAKRYSSKGRYYAWLIIITGLIIPFRPQFSDPFVKVILTDTMMPVVQAGGMQLTGPSADALPPAVSAAPHLSLPWWQAAAAVWLAGMAAYLIFHLIKHRRFMKMIKRWSERIQDPETVSLFQGIKTEMGLSKEIGLYRCASIGTPMLAGLIHPRILLPDMDFPKDDLCFILHHELVHYKRRDLWYKSVVLFASAVHWFNPVMCLIAREIDIQCEMSCDAEVVKCRDAGARQQYSEAIIGVVRYQSKMKTVLCTNFYGGKKGMKKRIFSIMDTRSKKAGLAVLCGALVFTLGTGGALAAPAKSQSRPESSKNNVFIAPWFSISFGAPNPDIYAPYAGAGLTISEDGSSLLYKGQPVRLFVDEKAESQAFYLNESGSINLSAVRNDAGGITGIEKISDQKAKEYQDAFFEDELSYQKFGITSSETDDIIYFKGQRVKIFLDQIESGYFMPFWEDDAGTVNVIVNRDTSGKITGIESISDKKVQEYLDKTQEYYQETSFVNEMDTIHVNDIVRFDEMSGSNKFDQYQLFGITCSKDNGAVYYNGQRVKLLVDQEENGWFKTFWEDAAGTVNLEVTKDASGQITGIKSITEEKAQEYRAAANKKVEDIPD